MTFPPMTQEQYKQSKAAYDSFIQEHGEAVHTREFAENLTRSVFKLGEGETLIDALAQPVRLAVIAHGIDSVGVQRLRDAAEQGPQELRAALKLASDCLEFFDDRVFTSLLPAPTLRTEIVRQWASLGEHPDLRQLGKRYELALAEAYKVGKRSEAGRNKDGDAQIVRSALRTARALWPHVDAMYRSDVEAVVKTMGHVYWRLPEKSAKQPPPTKAPPAMAIGRNEPCHCGSGKKYKKCCLLLGPPSAAENSAID
jgi:hypothetical protein